MAKTKEIVVRLEQYDNVLRLTSPYEREVVDKLKSLHGRWQPTSKTWRFEFHPATVVSLRGICMHHWKVDPKVELMVTPHPEDKPKRGWSGRTPAPSTASELVAKSEALVDTDKVVTKRNAETLVTALVAHLSELSPEEKEEVLKPIFDSL